MRRAVTGAVKSRLAKVALRTLLGLAALVVILVVIVIGAAGWILGTRSGGQWLFEQVPGLIVEDFQGQLGDQWQAQRLTWESDGTRLSVTEPRMDWSLSCLWRGAVCVHDLAVSEVRLTLPPGGEEKTADSGPVTLPDIDLPLTINVDRLALGRLLVNDTLVLQDLTLEASLAGSDLDLKRLTLAREDLRLSVSGDLTLTDGWPIDLHADYSMPLMEDQHLDVALDVRGRVAKNLFLEAQVEGYLAGSLSGQVQPLQPGVPAELTVRPTRLPLPESLPPTLRPEALELHAVGNLEDGWEVTGEARLPATEAPMELVLEGHVTTTGARIDRLALVAGPERRLAVTGTLDWADIFTAEAELAWRDFPLQRLLPDAGPLPVSLEKLDANVSYRGGTYHGNVDAHFDGPAGPSQLSTPFTGSLQRIELPELALKAGPGGITGSVAVDFANALGWQADLRVQDLNPGYWVEALPGQLGGTVRSEGTMAESGLNLSATVDLSGSLRDQAATLQLQAAAEDGKWQADELLLRLGDNRITGQAAQQEGLGASLDLALNRLGQLWPGLGGSVAGTITASGWPEDLQANVELQGADIRYNDLALESARIDAGHEGKVLRLDAEVTAIEVGGQRIDRLRLDGNGTLADHELRIRVAAEQGQVDLTFSGGSETLRLPSATPATASASADPASESPANGEAPAAIWRGALSAGKIQVAGQEWRLQSPAPLRYMADGQAFLGAHCWAWQDARLCMQDQRLWPEPRIRITLEDLPTSLTDPFLPPDVRWEGAIDGEVTLDIGPKGPRGQIVVDAGRGRFRVRETFGEEAEGDGLRWIDYPYDTLRLTADLGPEQIIANARLAGANLGSLDIQVALDPNSDPRALDGHFTLDGFDLALIRPFATLDELAGGLSGSGEIGGTLKAPTVDGQIVLRDGRLADQRLPLSFEELGVRIDFTESGAEIEGDWRSGEDGRGRISGEASWGDELAATIDITGEQLPARVEPYAEVEVAPDLQIRWADSELSITGLVAIPRGEVEIRELPPQAVTVSEDAVIVGKDQEEEAAASPVQGLKMDLEILVGEDRLTFAGFGVTGELVGQLHIGDNLDTRGELRLEDGQYEIYGQELKLREARLIFAGPISQPYLQIEAVREVDDVIVGIRLTGPADNPVSEVFSQPPMSDEQALSYLILGRPLQSQEDSNVVGTAAIAIGLNQAAPLTRAIGETVGIRDLTLDTEGSGDSQSIVASGYLTDRLSIRYGVSLFEAANRLALRYDLTKQLYLEAASGIASSLDIFYSRDF